MAVTRVWDETNPQGTQVGSTGPGYFVNHQVDIRERMNNGGVVWSNATKALDGLHAVNADGLGGPGPDLYKSDLVTKILQWFDDHVAILSGFQLTGTKSIPESLLNDQFLQSLVTPAGYKRGVAPLQITQSSPVDTKINVAAGIYEQTFGIQPKSYAGGSIAVSALTPLPAAGNHAYYWIVLDLAGTLTYRKGAEVIFANTPTAPSLSVGDTALGLVDVRVDSANFSLLASSPNAFLVQDGRVDSKAFLSGVSQAGLGTSGGGAQSTSVVLSKSITTNGGDVLVLASVGNVGDSTTLSIGRSGAFLTSVTVTGASLQPSASLVGIESIAAGTYTYQLRDNHGATASTVLRMILLELGTTSVF